MAQDASSDSTLLILHFNDAYHLEPSPTEPVGGASRYRFRFQISESELIASHDDG